MPWVHRLLAAEDEVVAALLLLLDWHSLATSDATFAEALYGLRRARRLKLARSRSRRTSGPTLDGAE